MDFIVPQFIEREAKILGPLSFKQSIFFGIAGALCVFLYFFIKSFWLFLIIALFVGVGTLLLIIVKVGGASLPDVMKNLFVFFSRPKIYLWRRKTIPPKVFKKAPPPKEEQKDEAVLKIGEKSRLRKLYTILETKTK